MRDIGEEGGRAGRREGRSVFFVDPPAFCTTVERLVAPALRSRPVAVAPPGADRATVLALSDEARGAGITRGMAVRQAKKLCPDLVLLPPNPELYARASRALHEVLRIYAPVIEPRGYGHAFLDLSGTERLFGPAIDVAARIHREVRERIGLPLSVGVAINKLVSEAAATVGAGDVGAGCIRPLPAGYIAPLQVSAGDEERFLAPHRMDVLPEVPAEIRKRLDDYQLELIGEVAAISESDLCAVFGRPGRELKSRTRGIDLRPVLPPEVRAEYHVSHTLATDTNDWGILHPLLRRFTEQLGRRLRQRHLAARRLTVAIDYTDYTSARRFVVLSDALLDLELWDAARRALTLAMTRRVAIRMISVTVDRLVESGLQLDLWDTMETTEAGDRKRTKPLPNGPLNPDVRSAAMQRALDTITTRWGRRVLSPHTIHGATDGSQRDVTAGIRSGNGQHPQSVGAPAR